MRDRPVRGSERTGKEYRFALSVNPVLQRPAGFRGKILAAARRFGEFFKLSLRLPVVFLPVRYIDPFPLQWFPQPETPESGKLGVGVRIRPNQEKGTASGQQRFFLKLKSHLQWGQ